MSFDDVLSNLFHAATGCRELDADVYEQVFGYSVRHRAANPRTQAWVYRDKRRWMPMGRITTDINDSIAFATTRVAHVSPLVIEAAGMIANRTNSAFIGSFPLALTYLLVLAKVGPSRVATDGYFIQPSSPELHGARRELRAKIFS